MEEQEKNGMIQGISQPLSEAKGWIKFLGVLSILGSTIGIATIAIMGPALFSVSRYLEYSVPVPGLLIVFILFTVIAYAAIIALCIRLGILLIQLSSLIEIAGDHFSLASLTEAQRKMKEIFISLGVAASIALIFYVASYLVSIGGLLDR